MFTKIKEYYFKKTPHITEEAWQYLENCLEIKHFKKGEHIIKQGEVCNHVYFVNKGFIRFYVTVAEKEISVGFIGPNEYVASYESFLTRQPSLENIDVLEDAELIALHYDQMQLLYQKHPVFENFGRKIAEFLFIWISQRNNALMLLTPEQRYRQMIANNSLLPQIIPQYVLASYIGVTPEHLSRLRKKIAKK